MLKRFTVLLLALFACSAFAEGFLRTPDGCIEAGGAKFRLSVFRSNWIPVDQGVEGVVTFPGEGATPTDAGMKRIGKFNLTADYSFDLTEIIDNRSEQELRIQYLFSTAAKSPTQLFAYKTYIPMEIMSRTLSWSMASPVCWKEKLRCLRVESSFGFR